MQLAQQRLIPFEQPYSVTSEYFIAEMTAENLLQGDAMMRMCVGPENIY